MAIAKSLVKNRLVLYILYGGNIYGGTDSNLPLCERRGNPVKSVKAGRGKN